MFIIVFLRVWIFLPFGKLSFNGDYQEIDYMAWKKWGKSQTNMAGLVLFKP